MTTELLRPTATVNVDGDTITAGGGTTITLDSGSVPYGTATVELPLLEDTALNWLDPRGLVRTPLTAGSVGATPRSFDLGLRTRTVDHSAKTLTLELATDEAILQDYATLTTDNGARAHETSLRGVCDYVLGKIGASLEAGTDNADVTAYWPITNLFLDPSSNGATPLWVPDVNAPTISRVAGPAHLGTYSTRIVATATGGLSIAATSRATASAGKSYTFSAYLVSNSANLKSARLILRWTDPAGTIIGDTQGAYTTTTTSWVRYVLTAIAPPGTAGMRAYIEWGGPHGIGNLHYIDSVMLYEGNESIAFYDGSTTDDSHYTYDWSGDTDASVSTRTPVIERSPDMFIWKPGVTAWDFLMPITSAAGLVLWCDELRKWRLALPENRGIATLVNVAPSNTRDGTDVLSRDDEEAYVTGVAVHYRWRDDNDIEQERYDTAGTEDKVLVVELERPYPGPGAAAAILARRQGTGRRQDVTAITQWATTPGMAAQVSLPGAPDTLGRITAVTFSMDVFMTLKTAGLVDLVPGSIAALSGTIDALVGTIDAL